MLSDRKRIMVVGSGGAGKSTFVRELGIITGLPVIHLDRDYWQSNWVPTPTAEWRRNVGDFASRDQWIIDGNYGSTLTVRVERCDALVFFDFGRLTCLWGATTRAVVQRGKRRPDMGEGCFERFDWTFLRWIWGYSTTSRPKVLHTIQEARSHVQVVILRTRRDVRKTLAAVCAAAA